MPSGRTVSTLEADATTGKRPGKRFLSLNGLLTASDGARSQRGGGIFVSGKSQSAPIAHHGRLATTCRRVGQEAATLNPIAAAPSDETGDRCRAEAFQYLEAVAERLRIQGVPIRTRLLATAETAKGLVQAAVTDADLLALETPERHGLGRLLHRSVVEKVVHDSVHPVLVLRQPERNLCSA